LRERGWGWICAYGERFGEGKERVDRARGGRELRRCGVSVREREREMRSGERQRDWAIGREI